MITESEIIAKLSQEEKIILINEENLHGTILHLSSKGIIQYIQRNEDYFVLTAEGKRILKEGSPEFNFFSSFKEIAKDSLSGIEKIGLSNALKYKWVKIENGFVKKNCENVVDTFRIKLQKFDQKNVCDKEDIKEFTRRKAVEKRKRVVYEVTRGESFSEERIKLVSEITADMIIKSDESKNKHDDTEPESRQSENFIPFKLKNYNFITAGILPSSGALHPLLKIREEFRSIFLEMGFTEMNTRKYVESSFWNFDALFQPQNHPSREAHDTFFIKNPKFSGLPEKYAEQVKRVHERGDYGSIGYGYEWSREEAMKNILRTHTTAVSARYLKAIGSFKEIKDRRIDGETIYHDEENPVISVLKNLSIKEFENAIKERNSLEIKLFSIDRVFRNESIDATHLAEFHQIEGLVVGENLTLKHLLGM
ncbi:putative phenylalanine--tRNA ligase alpha subunit, partial [Dictyocoela roeselum]